jgi:hypothetical protein
MGLENVIEEHCTLIKKCFDRVRTIVPAFQNGNDAPSPRTRSIA